MEPFLGEIRTFGFNFAPRGWALCNGQLMSIAQNTALFSLLGTTYGGDGQTTFGLPDLRGRFPTHMGNGPGLPPMTQGEAGGSPSATLNVTNMPAHVHQFTLSASSGVATRGSPAGAVLAAGLGSSDARFAAEAGDVAMAPMNSGIAGSSFPFSLQNPYLVMNFCIALEGIYPSRP
jgi:microcystin-dependent protein